MIRVNMQDHWQLLHHFFLSSRPCTYLYEDVFFFLSFFLFAVFYWCIYVCVFVRAVFRSEIIEIREDFWQKEIADGIIYSRRKRGLFSEWWDKNTFLFSGFVFLSMVINELLMVNFSFLRVTEKKYCIHFRHKQSKDWVVDLFDA
jgi:hypothetical protein